MKAIINKEKNAIVLQNFDRTPERPIFDKVIKRLKNSKQINVTRSIQGPAEDIVIAQCGGDEVFVCFDIDYGLCPIRCTDKNINDVLEIVNQAIDN